MTRSVNEAASPLPAGILRVTRNKLVLTTPPDRPTRGSLHYALAFPFQAGPRTAGLMVMRMIEELGGTGNYGFLDGSDVILFDEFKPPTPAQIFPASRNEIEPGHGAAPPRLFLKGPLIGGFVPLGALRADGSPHPHAGTGFAFSQAHWFSFPDGRFLWGDANRKDMILVHQLAYDGKVFTTRQTQAWAQNGDHRLEVGDAGWTIVGDTLRNAIPCGDDLLMATTAARTSPPAVGIGVVRWTRRGGDWQPADFDSVEASDGAIPQGPNPKERCPWMEPSLARDADGGLLFSARGADTFDDSGDGSGYLVRVWRLRKPGAGGAGGAGGWTVSIDQRQTRLNSPVTINTAADGSAYLVSNPYNRAFIPETGVTGRGREKLVIWPLDGRRSGLHDPLLVRDCLAEFGPPPAAPRTPDWAEHWMADHPNGATVRLKDGEWHHVLAYRICHCPRYQSSAGPPSKYSGSYIEEVFSSGPAIPVWRFSE